MSTFENVFHQLLEIFRGLFTGTGLIFDFLVEQHDLGSFGSYSILEMFTVPVLLGILTFIIVRSFITGD